MDGKCPMAAYLGSHGVSAAPMHSANETALHLERAVPWQRLSAAKVNAPILLRAGLGFGAAALIHEIDANKSGADAPVDLLIK